MCRSGRASLIDVEKLAELVVRDKRAHPSQYALVSISEGARMVGGTAVEYGEACAYGQRKLGNIVLMPGEFVAK